LAIRDAMTLKGSPQNGFYRAFDLESPDPREADDFRSPFQVDRDRIIYSSAFRRLQAKTQVFVSGEFDFYRTRLTHSLEVAQIGRSICSYLQQSSTALANDFFIDPDLVEAICLAHDIGHAPFGHAGERTLHQLMLLHGGFEGNAQSLRIITETIYPGASARRGMNPTRAFIDGILKYKRLLKEQADARNHFIYNEQEYLRRFVCGKSDPREIPDWNRFRSVECEIMDWADDTAYCLNDLVDSINAGFLRSESQQALSADELRHAETVIAAIKDRKAESRFSRKIGAFIRATGLKERPGLLSAASNRYRLSLVVDPAVRLEADLYKKLSQDLVFDHSQLHQLERKGRVILEGIFNALCESYLTTGDSSLRLLPESFDHVVRRQESPEAKARILCDYVAGMTDGFAVRTHKRLFDPGFGSILDLS
jgi:dGTPase